MKIDIIGRGNVGWHLIRAFEGCTDIAAVNPRSLEGLRPDAGLYLISVTDDAIIDIAKSLAGQLPPNSTVAHTSGTTDMKAVSGIFGNAGVFYPLQTFTRGVELDYRDIPVMLEYTNEATRQVLEHAASLISDNVMHVDSASRTQYHIASVLSCNFVNHLWTLAAGYLDRHNLDFQALVPLIKETARKLERKTPFEAQTGPAVRRDVKTLTRHHEILDTPEWDELAAIYSQLSRSIIDHHHPKT